MDLETINARGMVLLGGGKMGQAMLSGWLKNGVEPHAVSVIDPNPSPALNELGVAQNGPLPAHPAIAILAVKPQIMAEALPQVMQFDDTVFLSIAAGLPIAFFEQKLSKSAQIIRAMPNTPAAIGQGITAIVGNATCSKEALGLATLLLQSVGEVVELTHEAQMDGVTAVSGSGPAYVFHLIEALTDAGIQEGLAPELAARLALRTVAGAGALAATSDVPPNMLRKNVTSPNGTTAAGLSKLMDSEAGLLPLIQKTVSAAAKRSRELSNG